MSTLPGSCASEKIYIFLVKNGYTPAGACGIIGNLDHESGLRSNNLQDTFNAAYGSDTYYTDSINNKTYSKEKFMNDKGGYGLAQWTYPTRKRGLYDNTVGKGLSIDDIEGQLKYLMIELKDMPSLDNVLRTTNDVDVASDKFLIIFEAPAVPNYAARRTTSRKYYDKYHTIDVNSYEYNDSKNDSNTSTNSNSNTANLEVKGSYTVQKGDSWWSISCKILGTGAKMKELAALNGKTINDMLHPGDILHMPIEITNNTDANIMKETTDSTADQYSKTMYTLYIVKPGDSWWAIANEKLGSGANMAMLAEFNGRKTSDIIQVGEQIKIPVKDNSNTSSNYTRYTIKKYDTWKSIAMEQLGDINKAAYLAEFNGKTIRHPLVCGAPIKIPK